MWEAARFRGYRQSDWEREHWQMKARVLAHYLEHQLREAYAAEQANAKAKKQEPKGMTRDKFFPQRFQQDLRFPKKAENDA